ncbi:MAG TPA: type III-B CRISPR module-associated protein Cmr5 [Candidatus Hydrogenedentes bacterium]|nr:type III-B CRISPR module-associated protein Cmr5 [Candidatus Hydrogenedentota bacterium]HPG70127.1 type III-B CRISPR module-associated protein Cmr5 [Candidatus Hydrogenedentota bacterium]
MSIVTLAQARRKAAVALIDPLFAGGNPAGKDLKKRLSGIPAKVGFNGLLQTVASLNDEKPDSIEQQVLRLLIGMLEASPALADVPRPAEPFFDWLAGLDGFVLARVEQESLACLAALKSEVEARSDSPA